MIYSPRRRQYLSQYAASSEQSDGPAVVLYNSAAYRGFFAHSWPVRICVSTTDDFEPEKTLATVISPPRSGDSLGDEASIRRLVELSRSYDIPVIFIPSVSAGKGDAMLEVAAMCDAVLSHQPYTRAVYEAAGGNVLPVLPIRNAGFVTSLVLGGTDPPPDVGQGAASWLRRSPALTHPSAALERVIRKYPEVLFGNERISFRRDMTRSSVSTQEILCMGTHGIITDDASDDASNAGGYEGSLPCSVLARGSSDEPIEVSASQETADVYRTALDSWASSGIGVLETWLTNRIAPKHVNRRGSNLALYVEQPIDSANEAVAFLSDVASGSLLPGAVYLNSNNSDFVSELYWLTSSLSRRSDVQIRLTGTQFDRSDVERSHDLVMLRHGSRLGPHSLSAAALVLQGTRDLHGVFGPLDILLDDPSPSASKGW